MTAKMVYQWKPMAAIAVDAQIAGEHLERLRIRNNGQLTPHAVLADAKAKKSPLHDAFEWKNDAAAKEYRLWQARHLLNSIIVTVDGGKRSELSEPTRAFVSVKVEKKRSYTSRAHALSDEEMRRQMAEQAWKELLAWRDRYADLPDLEPLITVIDTLRRKVRAAKAA